MTDWRLAQTFNLINGEALLHILADLKYLVQSTFQNERHGIYARVNVSLGRAYEFVVRLRIMINEINDTWNNWFVLEKNVVTAHGIFATL
jgi:hypothetical protein